MSSQLGSLPEDVWRLVLAFSVPSSIRACQQVCRSLCDIVKSDVCLQYLLELDACGYVEPANPRWDLTYAQKLEMVRGHRSRWDHPESVVPTVFELKLDERGVTYEYAGGVYVRGVQKHDSWEGLTRQLYFYQLPSPNRGIEYKHWEISDLGFDVRDFGIDPEQDLLVLLEPGEDVYRIHLRTMSTNETHPNTSAGRSIIVEPHSVESARSFYFEISGYLLAVLFRSRNERIQSYVVIWDWTAGQELSRVHTVDGYSASFTLLSEDSFVVPRFSHSYEGGENLPGDTYGSLDLYQFEPHTTASAEATRMASFALPPLEDKDVKSSFRIRCAPTRVMPSYSNATSQPKVFDLSPNSRLLCLDIAVSTITLGMVLAESAGTLYVPCSLLLDSVAKRQGLEFPPADSLVVPWADWAEKTSWVETRDLISNNECFVFGQRMAGCLDDPVDFQIRDVLIFDFDQRRLKSRHMLDVPPGGEVHSPDDRTMEAGSRHQVGVEVFCKGVARPGRKYVKSTLRLDEAANGSNAVMIDDEHVVIKTFRTQGSQSLVVYTF